MPSINIAPEKETRIYCEKCH